MLHRTSFLCVLAFTQVSGAAYAYNAASGTPQGTELNHNLLAQADDTGDLSNLLQQLERLKKDKEALETQIREGVQTAEDAAPESEADDPFNLFFSEESDASGTAETANAPFGFSFQDFGRADIISLLHSGNLAPLEASPLRSLTYVANLSTKLADPSTLFLVDDKTVLLSVVDPTVSNRAVQKLTSTSHGMRELTNSGLQSTFGILGAIADARRDGLSLEGELQAMHKHAANSPAVQLDMIRKQGEFDAVKLAILSQTHPEDFKKIYRSIRRFVQH